jgi:hypothetical protein
MNTKKSKINQKQFKIYFWGALDQVTRQAVSKTRPKAFQNVGLKWAIIKSKINSND